jgi:hypothetical protein
MSDQTMLAKSATDVRPHSAIEDGVQAIDSNLDRLVHQITRLEEVLSTVTRPDADTPSETAMKVASEDGPLVSGLTIELRSFAGRIGTQADRIVRLVSLLDL